MPASPLFIALNVATVSQRLLVCLAAHRAVHQVKKIALCKLHLSSHLREKVIAKILRATVARFRRKRTAITVLP